MREGDKRVVGCADSGIEGVVSDVGRRFALWNDSDDYPQRSESPRRALWKSSYYPQRSESPRRDRLGGLAAVLAPFGRCGPCCARLRRSRRPLSFRPNSSLVLPNRLTRSRRSLVRPSRAAVSPQGHDSARRRNRSARRVSMSRRRGRAGGVAALSWWTERARCDPGSTAKQGSERSEDRSEPRDRSAPRAFEAVSTNLAEVTAGSDVKPSEDPIL